MTRPPLSDTAKAHYLRGRSALQAKDAKAAVAAFAQAVREDPRFAEAHRGLGLALTSAGERERGCKHLERACALYVTQARYAEAASLYSRLVKTQPEAKNPFAVVAKSLTSQGRPDKIRALFRRVLAGNVPGGEEVRSLAKEACANLDLVEESPEAEAVAALQPKRKPPRKGPGTQTAVPHEQESEDGKVSQAAPPETVAETAPGAAAEVEETSVADLLRQVMGGTQAPAPKAASLSAARSRPGKAGSGSDDIDALLKQLETGGEDAIEAARRGNMVFDEADGESKIEELRHTTRVPLCDCFVQPRGDTKKIHTILDISTSGVGFKPGDGDASRFVPGREILFDIATLEEVRVKKIKGTVVHSSTNRVGLRFQKLSKRQRRDIDDLMVSHAEEFFIDPNASFDIGSLW